MFTELSLLRPKRLRRINFSRADFLTKNENALIKPALFDFCCELHNKGRITLDDIKDLTKNYRSDRVIDWYLRGNFVFQCVNEALNNGNIEQIYLLRHYITDLHEHIRVPKHQHEHNELNTTIVNEEHPTSRAIVYRCIKLSDEERKVLQSLVGQLVTNKSFMSVTRTKDVALKFAAQTPEMFDSNLILFEINLYLDSSGIFDTDVVASGNYREHEILLDIGLRFRITKCELDNNGNIWLCELETTIQEPLFMQDLAVFSLNDSLSTLNFYENNDTRLNSARDHRRILSTKGVDEKQSVFNHTNRQLPFTTRPIEWAHVLQTKALIEWKQKNFLKLSNEWIQAIRIYAKCDTKYHYDDLNIIYCLNNIGYIYHLFGKDSLAIQLIKTSLNICRRQSLMEHPVFAQSCRNLGYVFANLGDYRTALEYHKRAVCVTRQSSPSAQWTTVLTLRNMGDISARSKNFSQSHIYYRKAAETYKKCMDIFIRKGYLEVL